MYYYLLHTSITKSLSAAGYKAIERKRMTTKRNNENRKIMRLYYHLMKRKKNAVRVNTTQSATASTNMRGFVMDMVEVVARMLVSNNKG